MDSIITVSGIGEKNIILPKAFQELCDGFAGLGFSMIQKQAHSGS